MLAVSEISDQVISRPEHELVVCCSRTQAGDQTMARIKTLLESGIDWDYLYRFARRHFVLPLLYHHTFPAVSGVADLCSRTSSAVVIATINDGATCGAKVPPEAAPCSVTVEGTTLETPPSQPNGSAYNSSMSAGTITLATPLAPGASINLQWLLGVQQLGNFRFFVNIEAL